MSSIAKAISISFERVEAPARDGEEKKENGGKSAMPPPAMKSDISYRRCRLMLSFCWDLPFKRVARELVREIVTCCICVRPQYVIAFSV
ncbi:hypothetical protein AAC387_Pa06g1105 [Persea americana]